MGLQYGIKEVLNLNIVDFATNKPIVYADYAEVTSNDNQMQRLDLRGGQGGYKVISFDHQKDSTFKITLPLVDLKLLALLTGEDSVVGSQNVFQREVLTTAAGKVTLSQIPVAGTLYVFNLTGARDNGTEITVGTPATTPSTYSLSGKDITLNSTSNADGSQVVCWYQYATPATATKISIKANKFPKAVKIFGDGIWTDSTTETNKIVKVTAFKAKAKGNFTFTMDMSNATKLDLEFDLFGVTDNTTGDIKYIDYVVLT